MRLLLVQRGKAVPTALGDALRPLDADLSHAATPKIVTKRLGDTAFDVILFDLTAADGWTPNELPTIQEWASHAPVVVLLDAHDTELTLEAVARGAQDAVVCDAGGLQRLGCVLECAVMRTRMAHTDHLTGLPNRAMLMDRIAHAMERARRNDEQVAVMFLDLDLFKEVNDTLGHAAGDTLLVKIAERLQACLRETDTVARLGGDEFVAVFDGLSQEILAADVAKKLIATLSEPIEIGGEQCTVSTSIGISIYPADGDSPDALLRCADAAMYGAKERGRGKYVFYRPDMNTESLRRMGLAVALQGGLQRQEFELWYLPQLDVPTGRVVAVEALLRWRHPERGLVLPEHFISLAEDLGLMATLGEWVVAEAALRVAEWREQGWPELRVAVNLSSQFLASHTDGHPLLHAERFRALDLATMQFDLTEAGLNGASDTTKGALAEAREAGAHIVIDDFGTGYISLQELRRLPIDGIKIDRRFVSEIADGENKGGVSEIALAIARNFGLNIVAEGVSERAQLDFLLARGCGQIQGYLVSKPVRVEAVPERLREIERDWAPRAELPADLTGPASELAVASAMYRREAG